ncbi:hypothetical protein [Lysobacter gummosus]
MRETAGDEAVGIGAETHGVGAERRIRSFDRASIGRALHIDPDAPFLQTYRSAHLTAPVMAAMIRIAVARCVRGGARREDRRRIFWMRVTAVKRDADAAKRRYATLEFF